MKSPTSMHSNSINKKQITLEQIARGINRQQVQGYHFLDNEHVNVTGGNPKLTNSKELHQHNANAHAMLHVGNPPMRISEQVAEDGLWLAENNRMGGFRDTDLFEGRMPVNYQRAFERDFRPTMVGDVQAGGAFQGGFLRDTLAMPNDKDEPAPMGAPLTEVLPSGVALRQVAPFPIRLAIKPQHIAHFNDGRPKPAPLGDAM